MRLIETINNDIKQAMRDRDKVRLSALRAIKSKLLLEATKEGGNGAVSDDAGLKILQKLYKQHQDSAAIYREQGREDLLEEEVAQAEVVGTYLPAPMSEEEIRSVVETIVADTGASGMADMGKVMGVAAKQLAGKADNKIVSGIVRQILAG